MGNCAAIQVGAYVDTCVGKPCSVACPTNACESPGAVCVNGMCIGSIAPGADCSLISNKCTASCIDKASCQECPFKIGCTKTYCDPECYTGEWCDAGVCRKNTVVPAETTCPLGCGESETCHQGVCIKNIDVTPPTPYVPPVIDTHGCNTAMGQTWCAAQARCHIEYEDPCVPITPVGGDGSPTPGVVTPGETPGGTTPSAVDTLLQNPQLLAILGIALLGGFVIMSGRK